MFTALFLDDEDICPLSLSGLLFPPLICPLPFFNPESLKHYY